MDLTPKKRRRLTYWVIGVAAACIAIIFGLKNIDMVRETFSWIIGLIMPLIIGLIIALIINVPMRFFEKILFSKSTKLKNPKIKTVISFIVSLILILGILAGVVWLVIPELVDAVAVIAAILIFSSIPSAIHQHTTDFAFAASGVGGLDLVQPPFTVF